ncbi:MAG: glycoside hydrolase family 16 protein [Verrucomicrobia bacterium]|nr:glycoside hydrolase family 16 protein [Verrucomicrobiota bacterium]
MFSLRISTFVWVFSCVVALAAEDSARWQLVWQDEFDGKALDLSKWEFEVNAQGGGNNELQYYVTNNAHLMDGLLVLEARKERYTGPGGTREYTSSRIRTKRKGDWQYGRFDIRARLPKGKGMWPAIWMMPTDETYGGWPNSGEIDIMELVGHEAHKVHGTLHYGDAVKGHVYKGTNSALAVATFADDFHVFRLDWEPEAMRWFVDGHLYQTQTNWHTRTKPFPAPFDQRFHLILNLAIGGNWPGNPDEKTVFPQAMAVDYVRVYRKRE